MPERLNVRIITGTPTRQSLIDHGVEDPNKAIIVTDKEIQGLSDKTKYVKGADLYEVFRDQQGHLLYFLYPGGLVFVHRGHTDTVEAPRSTKPRPQKWAQ
jgi:hypothetical protein